MIKTAFLPSAGLGKRLRPLTARVPKPLLPVKGQPILHHVMAHCLDLGVERFIINTHHHHEAFKIAFPDLTWRGHRVDLVHEPSRLETGGGLKNLEPLLDPDESLLIYNSDILTDLPLSLLAENHRESGRPLVTLASSRRGPHLHLVTDGAGRLLRVDRAGGNGGGQREQFLGISIVEFGFLQFLQKEKPESLVHGWDRALASDNGSVRTCEIDHGGWQDIGTLEAYEAVRKTGLNENTLTLGPPTPRP